MEVWFGRSFSFPKQVYFAGIPCVKLPKAFFFTYHPPPKIPGGHPWGSPTTKCRIFATNPTLEPLEEVVEPG